MLPFSSVVSLHTNPTTCGVAKFSAELALRLGVPFVGLDNAWGRHPLFSFKWSEFSAEDRKRFERHYLEDCYSVFWHDRPSDRSIDVRAEFVFHADPSLGPNGLWCPSLITPRKRPVRLFSFGMAHKLQTDKYQRVRELLDAASIRYHLRVSVGLHEGTSLDGAEKHFDALKQIMGEDNVTILGILSDDAVSEELANCDYVLAFFEKGLRANNTTVHAALDAGCRVISNSDEQTPTLLACEVDDINQMPRWRRSDSAHGQRWYSWDRLIEAMGKECDRSKLPTAS